ncbi:hypothetical protein D3C87_126030 [compost metagenome]
MVVFKEIVARSQCEHPDNWVIPSPLSRASGSGNHGFRTCFPTTLVDQFRILKILFRGVGQMIGQSHFYALNKDLPRNFLVHIK